MRITLDLDSYEAWALPAWLDGTDGHLGVSDRAAIARRIRTAVAGAQPCDACGAESFERCRPGCLGYAIEHDGLAGTEPCS